MWQEFRRKMAQMWHAHAQPVAARAFRPIPARIRLLLLAHIERRSTKTTPTRNSALISGRFRIREQFPLGPRGLFALVIQ
jgi:hypothetical protein